MDGRRVVPEHDAAPVALARGTHRGASRGTALTPCGRPFIPAARDARGSRCSVDISLGFRITIAQPDKRPAGRWAWPPLSIGLARELATGVHTDTPTRSV